MNAELIIRRIIGPNNLDSLKSIKRTIFEKFSNKDIYRKWKNNTVFKNSQYGKRCFILGNGPSLKDVNLGSLGNEFVFSVNNFSQVENYKDAHTNVHLWMDMSFFQMREDQKYDEETLMQNYYAISKEKAICFVPYECSKFIKEKRLDKKLDIHYLNCLSGVNEGSKIRWDISKSITGFATVIQYAIIVAMYMGFKEIYLLGCDTTNIVSVLNCAQNIDNQGMHAYNNDDVNERYKSLIKEWGMTRVFYDQYLLFLGYKMLYNECHKKCIKLINCSSKTIINEIPRMRLDEVIAGGSK